MKNKILIIIGILLLLTSISIVIYQFSNIEKSKIPDNYIAIFKGEDTEEVHKIYLYKNKDKKYPYKYIYTESKLEEYDKTKWEEKVIKKDKIKNIKKIFDIALEKDASLEVKYIKDGEIYTFEGFKSIALEWEKK